VLDVLDGALAELTWPELSLRWRRAGERDLLVLTGPEPDFRWRELATEVLELCLRFGVVEWISLGSLPAAVPHTRPVPILGTASKPGLLPEDVSQGPAGLLRVPSAALSAIEFAVAGAGVPAVGFYAQVPHYVGSAYPAAAIALLEQVGRHLGVAFETADLERAAESTRQRLDAAVAADEESRAYVARLEMMVDEQGRPAGEDLIAEIERFLRQRDDGGAGGDRPSPA
jgi:proteasome assembly chaperone (PAC2) family protein